MSLPSVRNAVAGGDAAEAHQSEGPVIGDRGSHEHESIGTASVDGQVLDLQPFHNLGDVGLGGLHQRRFAGYHHLGGGSCHLQGNLKIHRLSDKDFKILDFPIPETCLRNGYAVTRRRHQRRRSKNACVTCNQCALNSLGGIGDHYLRTGHRCTARIAHDPRDSSHAGYCLGPSGAG